MKYIFFLSLILNSALVYGQVSSISTDDLINGGIKSIISSQHTEDNIPVHWKGEWSSTKRNLKGIPYLGKKDKQASDSNCFTTTHIHNELAAFVLKNPDQAASVMPTLNLAFNNILTFKSNEDTFNFWHALPLTEVQKKFTPPENRDLIIHRPNQFELTNGFTLKRAHVAEDADDTSMAYVAAYLQQQLKQKNTSGMIENMWQPNLETVPMVFEKFRDVNRKGAHPLNLLHGNFRNTGAYLTWFAEQKRSFVGSLSIKWEDDVRIPFGVNDIDCVVNSNVLQMMAYHGFQNRDSVQHACRYIEKAVDKGLSKKCGFYYPNPYHLHYAVSKALDAGASCLSGAAKKLNSELINEQNANGSWGWVNEPKSIRKLNLREPISSTIYASTAMMIYADRLNIKNEMMPRIDKAVGFIKQNAKVHSDESVTWKAGVFFSGGGFVRRVLVWTSEAYTTMLAVSVLDRYRHYFESINL